MTTNSSEENNTYFIDPESGAEMARLIHQDGLITTAMGGALSGLEDFAPLTHALDLGCGPGGWVLDIAFHSSKIQVEGVDISQTMIDYAEARAHTQGLENAHFRVMDITKPLAFDENTFDLVNSRMIGFLPIVAWPELFQECIRITRPGGLIRFTEFESPGTTNSAGLEHLIEMFALALKRAGQNFSPSGHRIGITPMLRRLFLDAGYTDIKHVAHVIDYSAGTQFHNSFRQDWLAAFQLLKPFLIATDVITSEAFDQSYEQMSFEMMADDFCAVMFLLTVTGKKPEHESAT